MSGISPITASGASTQYERVYKKHFSNRGPSFALRETLASSSIALGSSPQSSPTASGSSSPSPSVSASLTSTVMDPFAGSFVVSASPSKASAPVLVPAATSSHVVDDETQAALQNLGYRIRSRISLGYNRSHSSASLFDSTIGASHTPATEREVLQSVASNARSWSRVQSAPAAAADFHGLRRVQTLGTIADEGMDTDGDINMDNDPEYRPDAYFLNGTPSWRKRSRELSDDDCLPEEAPTSIPSLSFSSSASSTTSNFPLDPLPAGPQSTPGQRVIKQLRHIVPQQTDPALSKPIQMDDDEPELLHPQPSSPIRYNFQDWIDRTDF